MVSEGDSMLTCKIDYDQVPLGAVRSMVEAQLREEAGTSDEIKNEPPERTFAAIEEPSVTDLSDFLAEDS